MRTGKIKGSDLTQLTLGMSKQEVVSVLGKPQNASANEKFEVYRYFEDYGNFRGVYHNVVFVDGKLKLFGLADNPDFKAQLEVITTQK
ncbi:MAG: hypothetical protein ACT4O4_03510 [Nitrospiraceae bacterium]